MWNRGNGDVGDTKWFWYKYSSHTQLGCLLMSYKVVKKCLTHALQAEGQRFKSPVVAIVKTYFDNISQLIDFPNNITPFYSKHSADLTNHNVSIPHWHDVL